MDVNHDFVDDFFKRVDQWRPVPEDKRPGQRQRAQELGRLVFQGGF